jgi:hypothetical protein
VAVIVKQTLPPGVPIDMLDAVSEEMGVDTNPPDGMIVHTHFEKDGEVRVIDVWESAEQHQRFVEARLMPAMAKVAAARGFDLPQDGAAPSMIDVHRVVRGPAN